MDCLFVFVRNNEDEEAGVEVIELDGATAAGSAGVGVTAEAGADDFLEKPIKIKLLIKKIEVLLKKKKKHDTVNNIVNGVILNAQNYSVTSDGETYSLTKKQFNLLELLMSKPDNVFKREKIMQSIWLDTYVSGRNLDVQIRKIREKIGNNKIKTIKGVGYLFTNK